MKLEATAKYTSNRKRNSILLIFILLLCFGSEGFSQKYAISFRDVTPLSEALLQASKTFNFKVAYDSRSLSSIYAGKEYKAANIDELINKLLKDSGFTFVYKHGCYLIFTDNLQSDSLSANTCKFNGLVIDSETGEQLPFASVQVPSQNIALLTTTNGNFSIKNIISNPVRLMINYIGYLPIDTLLTWSDQCVNHTFRLIHKVNLIDTVNVKSIKLEMVDYRNDVDFASILNPMRLIDMPAVVETDIFRTLQLLPGISYSENSSELNIRGGTSDQNLVLFDGQTLYNLSHYYGVFSSVNPNIVKDVQVYKGGFDSRYGERVSGIVDITGKSGNQLKPVLIADVNLLDINLATEIPVSKKLTIVAAGRRSYSDIYKTSLANSLFKKYESSYKKMPGDTVTISEPSFYFYDVNGKINYRISDQENISVSLYTGKDFYKNSDSARYQTMNVLNKDKNKWTNYGASIIWQKQWNNSFFSNVSICMSGYENNSENSTVIRNKENNNPDNKYLPDSVNYFYNQNKNRLKDISFLLRNTYLVNNYNQLSFGFMARQNEVYYYKDAENTYIYDNLNQSSLLTSVYLQDRISLFKDLIIKPGFRLSYYEGTGKLYLEPRFAAKYNINDQLSIRAASGKYNQFISQVTSQEETSYIKSFWVLANDSSNPVLSAGHFVLGTALEKGRFLIDVEGYYKEIKGIQEYNYISPFQRNGDNFDTLFHQKKNPPPKPQSVSTNIPSYFISGTGKSYGIDFFVRFKSFYFTNWLSYSVSKSVQNFDSINDGDQIPALTDKTHQISLSNLFTWNNWNVGLVFLYSTGRPYIDNTKNPENDPSKRYYRRMPDFFRCDLSTDYNFTFKNIKLKTGISIINLFDTDNYYDINSRTYNFENSSFSETNLVQSQRLSLNLFLRIQIN